MARKFLTNIDMNSQKVVNLGAPSSASDATNKTYVDNLVSGLSYKDEVKAATTTALPAGTYANGASGVGATFTVTANGAFAAVDGEATPALNDRYLVKDQASTLQNGIYFLSTVGTGGTSAVLTRVTDADTTAELNNATVYITNGTVNGGREYTQTTKNPVVGTDAVVFAQKTTGTTYTASLGVALSGSDFRLAGTVDGAGLLNTSGVLSVNAGTGLEVVADNVRLATQGTGISGGAGSTLSIDTSVVARYKSINPTTSTVTSYAFVHNLGNQWVLAQMFEVSGGGLVDADVALTDANTTTFSFASADRNLYRFVVVG